MTFGPETALVNLGEANRRERWVVEHDGRGYLVIVHAAAAHAPQHRRPAAGDAPSG